MVALKGERTGLLFFSIDIPLFPPLVFPYFHHCYSLVFAIVSFPIPLLPIVFVSFDTFPCRDHSIPLV